MFYVNERAILLHLLLKSMSAPMCATKRLRHDRARSTTGPTLTDSGARRPRGSLRTEVELARRACHRLGRAPNHLRARAGAKESEHPAPAPPREFVRFRRFVLPAC